MTACGSGNEITETGLLLKLRGAAGSGRRNIRDVALKHARRAELVAHLFRRLLRETSAARTGCSCEVLHSGPAAGSRLVLLAQLAVGAALYFHKRDSRSTERRRRLSKCRLHFLSSASAGEVKAREHGAMRVNSPSESRGKTRCVDLTHARRCVSAGGSDAEQRRNEQNSGHQSNKHRVGSLMRIRRGSAHPPPPRACRELGRNLGTDLGT